MSACLVTQRLPRSSRESAGLRYPATLRSKLSVSSSTMPARNRAVANNGRCAKSYRNRGPRYGKCGASGPAAQRKPPSGESPGRRALQVPRPQFSRTIGDESGHVYSIVILRGIG
jgi:hypothetical protein